MRYPHPSLESRAGMRLTDLQELRHERLVGSAGSDRAESCLVGGMRRLRSADLDPGCDHRLQQGEGWPGRSEEHTSELQSRQYLVCRLLLEKKKKNKKGIRITT